VGRRPEPSPEGPAMIIIGLGSGRCGTRSLAALLNAQPDTVCFHEVNPSCMAWTGTERTVLSMLEEFRAVLAGGPRQLTVDLASRRRAEQLPRLRSLEVVRAIGDVASYYLPYAPMLAEMPDVRLPVLRRDKAATIASFVEVMRIRRGTIRMAIDGVATLLRRRPYRRFRNHWVEHDGRRWRRSAKFDKCFPKFQADTLEDALGQYWDLYYRTAGELAAGYPAKVRIFDLDDLNTQSGQRAILEFCGLRRPVFHPVHANVKGRTGDPMLAAPPALADRGKSGAGS
jgi:Sulfotransferase family